MRIGSSLMSMFASRSIAQSEQAVQQALTRLATGKRINRAADDPSGLVAAEHLKAEQIAIEKTIQAKELENYRWAATDGAMSVISDHLTELNGLVVSLANTGATDDAERDAGRRQAQRLLESIDHLSQTSTYKDFRILEGFDVRGLRLQDLASALGDEWNPEAAQDMVEGAIDMLSTRRGAIGALMKSNMSETEALRAEYEQTTGAISRIEDADYASEVSQLIRAQVLEQSSIFSASLATNGAKNVLSLLAPAARLT